MSDRHSNTKELDNCVKFLPAMFDQVRNPALGEKKLFGDERHIFSYDESRDGTKFAICAYIEATKTDPGSVILYVCERDFGLKEVCREVLLTTYEHLNPFFMDIRFLNTDGSFLTVEHTADRKLTTKHVLRRTESGWEIITSGMDKNYPTV